MSERIPRIVLLGPPCSGKGETARRLAKRLGIEHICVSDLIAQEAKDHPAERVRRLIQSTMKAGGLVDDRTVCEAITQHFIDNRPKGWVLDGAPRTLGQAETLYNFQKIGGAHVFFITIKGLSHRQLWERARQRGREDRVADVFDARIRAYNMHINKIERFVRKHPLTWHLREVFVTKEMAPDAVFEAVLSSAEMGYFVPA